MDRVLIFIGLWAWGAFGVLPAQTSFSSPESQRESAPSGIHWMGGFDAARAKAKAEGLPLMVFFTMNGEPANEHIHKVHLHDADVIAASRAFVCVVCCPHPHEEHEVEVTGAKSKIKICDRFGSVSCKDHVKDCRQAREELLVTESVRTPQFLWLAPDGKTVLESRVWTLSVSELVERMKRAKARHEGKEDPASSDFALADAAIKGLGDKNLSRRREALNRLIKIDAPQVLVQLTKMTGPRRSRIERLDAIKAMASAAEERFLPILHELLFAREADTRTQAANAIKQVAHASSAHSLAKALKKERKEDVRSHMLRALLSCGRDDPLLREQVLLALKRSSRADRITGLWVAAQIPMDKEIKKSLSKYLKTSNQQVRAAAYFVVGSHKMKAFEKRLKMRLSGERNLTASCCAWALAELRGVAYEADEDPASLIERLLPAMRY